MQPAIKSDDRNMLVTDPKDLTDEDLWEEIVSIYRTTGEGDPRLKVLSDEWDLRADEEKRRSQQRLQDARAAIAEGRLDINGSYRNCSDRCEEQQAIWEHREAIRRAARVAEWERWQANHPKQLEANRAMRQQFFRLNERNGNGSGFKRRV